MSFPPRVLINKYQPFKTDEDLKFESIVYNLMRWWLPEQDIMQDTTQVIGPSSSSVRVIEPPDAEQFWNLFAIDINVVSPDAPVDFVTVVLQDAITARNFMLAYGPVGNFTADSATIFHISWPGAQLYTSTLSPGIHRPLTLKRKSTRESWKRLQVTLNTSATLGNRSITWKALIGFGSPIHD